MPTQRFPPIKNLFFGLGKLLDREFRDLTEWFDDLTKTIRLLNGWIECAYCEEVIHRDDSYYSECEDDTLCECCYHDNFCCCEGCGKEISIDWCYGDDGCWCSECYEEYDVYAFIEAEKQLDPYPLYVLEEWYDGVEKGQKSCPNGFLKEEDSHIKSGRREAGDIYGNLYLDRNGQRELLNFIDDLIQQQKAKLKSKPKKSFWNKIKSIFRRN
jgi:hypothetical protein